MRSTRSVAFKFASFTTAILMSLFSVVGVQTQSANAAAALASGQASANMWSGIGGTGSMLGTLALMGKIPALSSYSGAPAVTPAVTPVAVP